MTVRIVPITLRLASGFHAALDSVAREGRYLAMLEAPSVATARRFVRTGVESGSVHYVALVDDSVVGWCDVSRGRWETQRLTGTLGMGIVAAHRGQGIGTDLLTATLTRTDALGMTRVELRVRTDNAPAIRLYEKFGFTTEGICRRYLRIYGQHHDALLMARVVDCPGAS